ncbi:MAG: PAS domain S-box protein [Xanthobacteraceae bacterium]|nr:PAS domain S-box protein [Xanthobacteraceae bacterium]
MPHATPAAPDFDPRLRAELERRVAMAPAMMHSVDERGHLVFVSDAWLETLGYARNEVLGRHLSDFLTAQSREHAMRDVLPELLHSGRCANVHYRMVKRDGGVIDVLLSAVLDDNPLGRGRGSLAVITDVTALKQTRRALAESEARYRFLAENTTDVIMLLDRTGRRHFVSQACRGLAGYEPEEMLAIRSADMIHPEDVERVLAILHNETAQVTVTYRMQRKDGSYIWVEASFKPVEIDDRSDLCLLIIRNIEERMAAQRRLEDSEARYRLLADNSSDMVFQLDRDLVRRYVSPACREILGLEPEQLIGKKPITMVHPDDAARLALVFQTLMSGAAERQSIVNRMRHRDGRWIWLEAQFRVLKDPETGAPSGVLGSVRDISARKAVEDELAEANRRLKALAGQDGLTGLANRRIFDETLAKEHLRARREHTTLALIMIDVDRFKSFNDIYGHPAGDDCLRRVSRAIADAISRPGDLAARYGGEEFAVLLPNTDEAGAERIAERILLAILGLGIPHEANANGVVTVSAGVAALACAEAPPESLVDSADHALYRAKDFGRNAVIRATEVAIGEHATPSAVA